MLKLIISNTQKDEHGQQLAVHVELPAAEETLQKAAGEIGLSDFDNGGYEIIGHSFGKYEDLQNHIPGGANINELNLLAHQFKGFAEEQAEDFMSLLTDCGDITVKDLINKAYYLEDDSYEIWHGVMDLDELGHRFVEEKAPDLPEEIFENIDYEDVGYDVQSNDHGKFTNTGYIRNSNKIVDEVYNGTNLIELIAKEREKQKSLKSKDGSLSKEDVMIKATIDGLTATAVEKACVLGVEATEDIGELRKTAAELIRFWSLDERWLEQFDMEVQTVMEGMVRQSGMQIN